VEREKREVVARFKLVLDGTGIIVGSVIKFSFKRGQNLNKRENLRKGEDCIID